MKISDPVSSSLSQKRPADCTFGRRFETEFKQLREERDDLVPRLNRRLRTGCVIIIDIR